MLEEWVWDYETVAQFARNADGEPLPQTVAQFARNADGEPLPQDLHDKMLAERDFGLGIFTRGQLGLATVSLNLYNQHPDEVDFDALWNDAMTELTPFAPLEGNHRWASFGHLNGYSAIYYTYQWSLAIATDMFTRFEEAGLRNVEVAKSYRDKVLAPGSSRPAEALVTDFLDREISFKPYADRLRGM
jgi:thimet oligopeptidase